MKSDERRQGAPTSSSRCQRARHELDGRDGRLRRSRRRLFKHGRWGLRQRKRRLRQPGDGQLRQRERRRFQCRFRARRVGDGGYSSTASGLYTAVTGGNANISSSDYAAVCGGGSNTASDTRPPSPAVPGTRHRRTLDHLGRLLQRDAVQLVDRRWGYEHDGQCPVRLAREGYARGAVMRMRWEAVCNGLTHLPCREAHGRRLGDAAGSAGAGS